MAKTNLDDKWAWAICMANFWVRVFIHGVVRSSGVFFASMVQTSDLSREEVSWPFNLCMALDGLGVFLTGMSSHHFIIRRGVPIAVLMFFSGYALSSLTKNIPLLTFLIGLIGGLSQGYVMGSSFILMCHFFVRYRTTATGISTSGSSIGGMAFPYLCNYLIEEYGLSGSYLLIAGVSLQAMIGAMLCRFISLNEGKRIEEEEQVTFCKEQKFRSDMEERRPPDPEEQNSSKLLERKQDVISSGSENVVKVKPNHFSKLIQFLKPNLIVLKHPVFYIYALSFTIANFCIWSWVIIIVDFAKDRGLTQSNASYLLSVLSISDLCGRLCYGWIIDFGFVKKKTAVTLLFFCMSLNSFLMTLFSRFAVLFISTASFGFLLGCLLMNRATVPAAYFGLKGMSSAIGLGGLMATGISLLRPLLIGIFRDKNGNYDAMFLSLGAVLFIGGVMWLFEPLAMRFHNRKVPAEQENDDV